MAGWFVTGTDTEVGKTLVSCALLLGLREQGLRVAGMKPVAAGAVREAGALRNEDALALVEHSHPRPDYDDVNPYVLEPPIAPHIAARRAGLTISLARLVQAYEDLAARYERVVVEGAGGWLVPVDGRHTLADLAARLGLPVIVVVAIRLGGINHALLTAESVAARSLPVAGWVATHPAPYEAAGADMIDTLRSRIAAPLLGIIPYRDAISPATAAPFLDLGPLSP